MMNDKLDKEADFTDLTDEYEIRAAGSVDDGTYTVFDSLFV